MITVLLVISPILAISQAASLVPIDSSSVNVKQSGQDYSYTIQENHGVAIDPSHVIHQQTPVGIPTTKTGHLPTAGSLLLNQIDQGSIHLNQEQLQGQGQDQTQTRLQGQIQDQTQIRLQGQLQDQTQIRLQGQLQGQIQPSLPRQIQGQIQSGLIGQIQSENVRPQEQLKAINYVAPPIETYHVIPSNIQYGFSYPYGLHYPINLIRIV